MKEEKDNTLLIVWGTAVLFAMLALSCKRPGEDIEFHVVETQELGKAVSYDAHSRVLTTTKGKFYGMPPHTYLGGETVRVVTRHGDLLGWHCNEFRDLCVNDRCYVLACLCKYKYGNEPESRLPKCN